MTEAARSGERRCGSCKERKPATSFNRGPGYCKECNARKCRAYHRANRERRCAAERERHAAARNQALLHYGGWCACCGEADPRFLTLDHVDGGGNEHRRTGEFGPGKLAFWLRANGYPPGYQVLCWNCNCARSLNGGVCPHKLLLEAVTR